MLRVGKPKKRTEANTTKKHATPHQSPWSKWMCQFGKDRGRHSRLPVRAGRWGKYCEHRLISTTSHRDEARLQPETSPAIVTVQIHCHNHTIQGLPLRLSGLAWSLQFQPDFLTTWHSPAAITLFPCSLFIPSFVSLKLKRKKKTKKKTSKKTKGKKPRLIKTRQWLHFAAIKKIQEKGFPFSGYLDHFYFWL